MLDEIRVLQALRLKGMPTASDVVDAVGSDGEPILRELVRQGRCTENGGRHKLTTAGRDRLALLLAEERSGVDQRALADLYERFDAHNTLVKTVVTEWQLKGGSVLNDHGDPDYDQAVVARLGEVHRGFEPLLARIVAVAPRLAPYPGRLSRALARVGAGDHSWFAKPLVDSYHTVWFELHEDLITLLGRTREAEAAAGRAG
ncbi:hypothetical protein ACIQMJ_31625 [Actinosynnema sp. NPDC091369]